VIAQQIHAGGLAYPALLAIAFSGLLVGIGFKIAAVPFHFWCPDVFEGASIEVTTFLSVASKGAALVVLLRIVSLIAGAYDFQAHHGDLLSAPAVLAIVLGVLGTLSATVGNTAAFVQNNIKRLLAYSSIAHAGYMLCAMSLLLKTAATPDPIGLSSRTILFYLAVYVFMNLGAFTVAGLVERQSGTETLDGFAGLSRRNPILAACMTLFLFSFVGLPPLAGFFAKFNILVALGQAGGWWWVLVGVILINTVLSLYYYMRVVRAMYLVDSDAPAFVGHPLGVAISLMCAIVLVLMFVRARSLGQLTENYGRVELVASPNATMVSRTAVGQ
jgi:NADH-quinone oxidoreductase subunit N